MKSTIHNICLFTLLIAPGIIVNPNDTDILGTLMNSMAIEQAHPRVHQPLLIPSCPQQVILPPPYHTYPQPVYQFNYKQQRNHR